MWEIKGKDNQVKATVGSLEYNGEWMGESYVTVTVESPAPVNFEIGDYIIYRDERFEINYDPGKIKSAPRYEKGDAFKYENIKFNSLADELTRCDFLDIVLEDNQIHFTGLPKFSFYGGVQDLANRMQANLDRTYGKGTWSVVVSPEFQGGKEVNISVDTIKVQGALSILVNDLETYYTIKGRTITIGAAGIPAGHLFKYGKGNGLYEIEQNAEADQAIVTRLRAYGSTRNLPHRYYNSLSGADGKKLIPDNMAVQYLMLPEFPYTTQDPYINSPNIAKLGVREGTVFFDGSGELEEIYPSIEGMTAEDLHKARVPCNSTGALDEIVSAEQMTDNGVGEINEGETQTTAKPPTFKVTLKDLGFDINDHLTTETATLSFKTGMLGGRDFEIVKNGCKPIKDASGKVTGYELELNRVYDDGIKLWFPYKDYNAKAGNKVVILHIEMPEVYIKAAAQRLKEAAKEWLSKNDYSRSIYAPKVDEVFMARQHDLAMASGGTIESLHDTLKEGMLLFFEDEDLNIDASIFIDRLTIKEGDSPTPTYEVVLKEEKTVGRLDKMQNQIDSLASGGQGGGYSAAQIRNMISAYGLTQFLSKLKDDRAKGKIASDLGFEIGNYLAGVSGGMFGINADSGESFADVFKLYVRGKAYFETLTTIEANALAGKRYITPGGAIKCTKVEEVKDADGNITVYRCYFLSEQDGEKTETKIIAGDQAISEMFNAKTETANKVSNHRYWRLVTAVNNDAYTDESGNHYGYIDLSASDCESDSDIPKEGDVIDQLGNRTDVSRQAAMIFSTVDPDAPSIKLLTGIGSGETNAEHYSLVGKDIISQGYDPAKGHAFFKCYGDMYIGDPKGSTYISYDQDAKELIAKLRLSLQSPIGDKTLGDLIEGYDASKYLREALPQNTDITGGVILSTLLSLGYKDEAGLRHTLAGMNGSYIPELGAKTIASWWGGDMIDRENAPAGTDLTNAATSLIRLDGSGYFSKGAFSWDAIGNPTFGSGVKVILGDDSHVDLSESMATFLNFIGSLSKGFVPATTNDNGGEIILPWSQIEKATYIKALKTLVSDGDLQSLAYADPIEGDLGGSVVGLLTSWAEYDSTTAKDLALSAELGHGLLGRIQWLEGAGFLTAADISHLALNKDLTAHINDTAAHITAAERAKWNKTATDLSAILGTDSDTIINKWEEVIAFLDTYTEADTLANLLSHKADKATTLAGYGITDAYTKTALDTLLGNKVSKSGDTMTGLLKIPNYLTVQAGNANRSAFGYSQTYGSYLYDYASDKYLGIKADGTPHFHGNKLWHSGNDGAGSGLDADLLDGLHADSFVDRKVIGGSSSKSISQLIQENYSLLADSKAHALKIERGAHTMAFGWFLSNPAINPHGGWFVANYGTPQWVGVTDGVWVDETFAFLSSTVAAADKLSNDAAFTAWGQTFFENGVPKSVSGNMTGVGTITFASAAAISIDVYGNFKHKGTATTNTWSVAANNGTIGVCVRNDGNVGIGTTSPSEKLDVAGTTRTSVLKIGSITLKDVNGHLEIDKTIVSLGDVQSLSASDVVEGGGMIADMLTKWGDYKSTMADTHALSAGLGVELHNRLTGIENSYVSKTVADELYQPKGSYVTTNTAQTISGHKTFSGNIVVSNMLYFKNTARENGIYIAERLDADAIIFSHHKNYSWVKTIGTLDINGALTMNSFVKSGGTSAQFLKADGSVTELTALDDRYVTRTTPQTVTAKKTFTDIGLGSISADWNVAVRSNSFHWLHSSTTASPNAPGTYWSGVSFMTEYVGFQLAVHGGGGEELRYRKISDGNTWTAWRDILHSGNYNSFALPLTGGTLTGALTFLCGTDTKLIFDNTDGEKYTKISFREAGAEYGALTVSSTTFAFSKLPLHATHYIASTTTLCTNLNADLLDGQHGEYYLKNNRKFAVAKVAGESSSVDADTDLRSGGMLRNYYGSNKWVNAPNGMAYGEILALMPDYGNVIALSSQLAWDSNNKVWFRVATSETAYAAWRELAFTDSNVASATNADKTDGYHADIYDTASTLVVRDTDAHVRISAIRNSRSKGAALSSAGWYRVFTSIMYDAFGDTITLNIARSFNNTNNEAYQFAISLRTYESGYKPCITQMSGVYASHLITKIRVVQKYNSIYYIDIYYSGTNANHVYVSGFGTGIFCDPVAATIPDGYTATEFDTVQGVKSNHQIISTDSFRLPYSSISEISKYLQLASGGNELIFSAGNETSTMFVNYRAATIGTTVTKWIWCAGSSSTRAAMEMGDLTAASLITTGDIRSKQGMFVSNDSYGGLYMYGGTAYYLARIWARTNTGAWTDAEKWLDVLNDCSTVFYHGAEIRGNLHVKGTIVADGDIQSLSNGADYSGNGIVSFEVTADNQVIKIPSTAPAVYIRTLLDGGSYTIEFEETPPAEVSIIPIYVYETSPGDGTIKWNGVNGLYKGQFTYYGSNIFALVRFSSAYFVLRKFSTGN